MNDDVKRRKLREKAMKRLEKLARRGGNKKTDKLLKKLKKK